MEIPPEEEMERNFGEGIESKSILEEASRQQYFITDTIDNLEDITAEETKEWVQERQKVESDIEREKVASTVARRSFVESRGEYTGAGSIDMAEIPNIPESSNVERNTDFKNSVENFRKNYEKQTKANNEPPLEPGELPDVNRRSIRDIVKYLKTKIPNHESALLYINLGAVVAATIGAINKSVSDDPDKIPPISETAAEISGCYQMNLSTGQLTKLGCGAHGAASRCSTGDCSPSDPICKLGSDNVSYVVCPQSWPVCSNPAQGGCCSEASSDTGNYTTFPICYDPYTMYSIVSALGADAPEWTPRPTPLSVKIMSILSVVGVFGIFVYMVYLVFKKLGKDKKT